MDPEAHIPQLRVEILTLTNSPEKVIRILEGIKRHFEGFWKPGYSPVLTRCGNS
jgi:hypothetical protein